MTVILGVLIPYIFTSAVLLLIWRCIHRTHPYLRLIVIHLAVFALWHVGNAMFLEWRTALPHGIEEWLATIMVYVIGIAFFVANYTCIEGDTPSMILFTLLEEAGPEGCDEETLVHGFGKLGHVEDRLGTMESRGLVRRNADGSLSATRRGKLMRLGFDLCFRPVGRGRNDPQE